MYPDIRPSRPSNGVSSLRLLGAAVIAVIVSGLVYGLMDKSGFMDHLRTVDSGAPGMAIVGLFLLSTVVTGLAYRALNGPE